MQTPKFPAIASGLAAVLSAPSFRHIWKNKIRNRLRLSDLRDPIDHFDFHLALDQRVSGLSTRIKDGRYTPSPHKRFRVEKSKGLCRQLVSPAVDDCLVLQALSDFLFAKIVACQPTKKAYFLPSDGGFNKKFDDVASHPYGSMKAWVNFQKRLFEFPEEFKFIVVTDVANYYDFINFSQLRNVISSHTKESESIIDLLIYVLAGLSWQPDYMPRQLTGLPQIDIDAPRLLAHGFLFEVDAFIEQTAGLDHVRFMDDIDIGANTISEAKKVLRDVDLIMQSRQVRLNSGKTKILTADEARSHFCIKENHVLSVWQAHIDWKKKKGWSLLKEKNAVPKIVRQGLRSGRFNLGNGEKVLKRLITTATKIDAKIRLEDVEAIIRLRPGARSNAFWHLSHRVLGLVEFRMIERLVLGDVFVDHSALFGLVRCLLQSRVRRDRRITSIVRRICDYLEKSSEYGVILSQRLALRYLTPGQIIHFTGNKRKVWQPDIMLGRFIGSAGPFLFQSKEFGKYRASILKANNEGANQTLEFFDDLLTGSTIQKEILNYCKAPNTSLPLGANIEKISMLIAIWNNKNTEAKLKAQLAFTFSTLMKDPQYKRFFP